MKKLMLLLGLTLLFSCEKKEECKTCITTYYASGASIGKETIRWIECGPTEQVETKMPDGGFIFPLTITTCK